MRLIRVFLKGLGLSALALFVITLLPAAPAHALQQTGVWVAEYFDNLDFSGTPTYTEVVGPSLELGQFSLNWEWRNAHPELDADWSARFTLVTYLSTDNYAFKLMCGGSCRMYLNGYLIFDQSEGQFPTWFDQRILPIPAGTYILTVDYFSHDLGGNVSALVEPTDQVPSGPDAGFPGSSAPPTDGQGGGPPPGASTTTSTQPGGQVVGYWTGEYFTGIDLEGAPVFTEVVGPWLNLGPSHWNWEWADAHPELNANWSARFTLVTHLDQGNYRFGLLGAAGCRMYINGAMIFDQWEGQFPTWYDQRIFSIPAGTYAITVEYFGYDRGGSVGALVEPTEQAPSGADASFVPPGAVPSAPPSPPSGPVDGQGGGPMPSQPAPPAGLPGQQTGVWTAEYFGNLDLEGAPIYTEVIGPWLDAEWGWQWANQFPELVETGWSARFTLVTYLSAGNYKFNLSAEDGGRMYVNGILILDQWEGGYPTWYQMRLLAIPEGWHVITVEYNNFYGMGRLSAIIDPTDEEPGEADRHLITAPASAAMMPDGQGGGPMPGATTPSVTSVQIPTGGVAVDQDNPKTFISSGYMNWHWMDTGYAGNHVYTPNGETSMSMWGRWNYIFPRAGYYDVYTYIPAHANATINARYRVFADNALSPVIAVNQATHANQWVYLGTFYFQAGGSQYVYLNDLTFEEEGRHDVVFDAVAFIYSN
jgi:hypothetical protein